MTPQETRFTDTLQPSPDFTSSDYAADKMSSQVSTIMEIYVVYADEISSLAPCISSCAKVKVK